MKQTRQQNRERVDGDAKYVVGSGARSHSR